MIELPDDELDKLFRKSSEELDPYFDPNDWNDLKKRLDDADGIRPAGWLRKWWPFGVLLIFLSGGLVYYFATDENKTENQLSKVASERLAAASAPNEIVRGGEKKTENIESENKGKAIENAPNPASPEKSLTKSKNEKILPLNRSKAGGVYLEPNRSSGKGGEGAFSSNVKRRVYKSSNGIEKQRVLGKTDVNLAVDTGRASDNKLQKPVDHEDAVNKRISGDSNQSKDNSSVVSNNRRTDRNVTSTVDVKKPATKEVVSSDEGNGETILSVAQPVDISADILTPHPFDSKLFLSLPLITTVPQSPEVVVPAPQLEPTPKLTVRFAYSPDLSSVGLKDFSKPGGAVSILGEFGIGRRWFLQSGVIWSRKVYSASAGSYKVERREHYYGPDPQSVDGICKVFEVPMNFRYDIAQGRRSRWFAGAGVSSYHMNAETYYYHFENESDPKITDKDRGWHGRTGWYWLSHINASAGYEYRLSERLSIMAEPYVRIPIKKVGYGNVKLFTTGVWLSVRYTPVFK